MIASLLSRSEARQAAEHLARAEAWLDQVPPELQPEIARIRTQLLRQVDGVIDPALTVRR